MSVIKFVVLLQDGCLIRSRNYLPFTIPYVHYLSFMRRVLVIKTSATRRAETAHRSGAPEFTRCLWSFCCVICGFCLVFCRLMFVRLSFYHLAIVLSIIYHLAIVLSIIYHLAIVLSIIYHLAIVLSVIYHLAIVLSVIYHLAIVLSVIYHLAIVLSIIYHLAIVLSIIFHLAIVLSIIFRPTASDYHKVSSISSNRDTQWVNTRLW